MRVATIAARELRSLFLSPLAWTALAIAQTLVAYQFLYLLETYTLLQPRLSALESAPGVTDLVVAPVLGYAGFVLLLMTPLLSMRILSEERRSGSLSLLLSAPVSSAEIVLGKYAGLMAFLLIATGLACAMPLSLSLGTSLDMGKLAAGVVAQLSLLGAFAAVGLYMSAIASHPAVAAISSFGALLLLGLIHVAGKSEGLLAYLSVLAHYQKMLRGLIHSTDLAYFVLFAITFVVLSVRHLEGRRLGA
jgi:ABC-2 type transport system permease protein